MASEPGGSAQLRRNQDDDEEELKLTHTEKLTIKARMPNDSSRHAPRGHSASGGIDSLVAETTVSSQRGVLVIYTGGTLGMKRNAEGNQHVPNIRIEGIH